MIRADSELFTPDRVRSAAFTPTRLGRRGVDEAEVRAFCEWISEGLGRLLNDNNMLQAEMRTFSDVCRTHLRAYLESLTRSIEEWERAEHNGALAAKDSVLHH